MMFRRLVLPCCAAIALSVAAGEKITLGDYTRAARRALENRIRETLRTHETEDELGGTVTAVGDNCFFIQGDSEGVKVVNNGPNVPAPGDVVLVKGHPSLDGGRVVLVADSFHKVGSAEFPKVRPADGESLSSDSSGINWLMVELHGRAIGLTQSGFALEVDSVPVTVVTDSLPDFLTDCDRLRPMVSVRGVVEQILDQSALFGSSRDVMGVRLRIRSSADIALEPDIVYLANCRDRRIVLFVAVVILLLVIGLVALVVHSVRMARRQLRTKTLMAERKRMADDLHDTIEQHLVGAGMLLQLSKTKEAREILVRAKREIRDIVWGLKNDDMMRLSPSEMVRQLAHDETKKGICRVSVRVAGLPDKMDASSMRDLSLVIREAIGNAVKHGQAKKIAISSDPCEDGGWLLRIANDGAPFDAASAPGPKEGHFGLEGMRSRARRFGAEVAFTAKGGWTVVSVTCRGK